jgi:hypothetical protein
MLAVCALMLAANYFFLAWMLRPVAVSWWTPIAIMSVGMFVLFGQETIWAHHDASTSRNASRIIWTIELLPAAVASLLIGCLCWAHYPGSIIAGSMLFVLILFLFCGKLVIHLKARLISVLESYRAYQLGLMAHRQRLQLAAAAVQASRIELSQLQDIVDRHEAEWERLRASEIALLQECAVKRSVFLSEYHFAGALRNAGGSANYHKHNGVIINHE